MVNLMRDLGYDESDPEVIEARAAAKRDENLRTLADAEAGKVRIKLGDGEYKMSAPCRGAYVEGFIAGRTSVTREQIAAALAEPGAMDAQNHDLRQADRVLALLNGGNE